MTMTTFENIRRSSIRQLITCLAFAAVLATLIGCAPEAVRNELRGETMGTTYSIRWAKLPDGTDIDEIRVGVEERLAEINHQMSNWDKNSQISEFNRFAATDWFSVSHEVALVLDAAQTTSRKTQGAFDVTVGPLIEIWGFGAAGRRDEPPDAGEISAVRASVGWEKLEIRLDPPALKKRHPSLTVNLSAIAKGYGVDAIGETLESRGINHYLVEIGGEIRTRGTKEDGSCWRVGIARPESGTLKYDHTVDLADESLATSGDYRNYIESDGRRFSHTIDPATARPVDHSLASASVVAESTMQADAHATAIMVMGPKNGYNYAVDEALAALLITHTENGLSERRTPAWIDRFGDK